MAIIEPRPSVDTRVGTKTRYGLWSRERKDALGRMFHHDARTPRLVVVELQPDFTTTPT